MEALQQPIRVTGGKPARQGRSYDMNHLAHSLLAGPEPLVVVGNLIADFVRGAPPSHWPEPMVFGLKQHRRLDSRTDAHPVFARSRNRIKVPYRRYAGIIVDMAYDHFLARHWSRYHSRSLGQYSDWLMEIMDEHWDLLPPRMQRFFKHVESTDLLVGYQRIEVIGESLAGISRRLKRENPLASAVPEIQAHYRELEDDFFQFFVDIQQYNKTWKDPDSTGGKAEYED